MIGRERAQRGVAFDLDEIVKYVPADEFRVRDTEGGQKLGRRHDRVGDFRREVELDPIAHAIGGEQSALGVKARLLAFGEVPVLPQNMRARYCRMAAQRDFDRGSEPAQVVIAILRHKECRLRKVHFARHVAHPLFRGRAIEYADGRWIPREWPISKRIHLHNSNGHDLTRLAQSKLMRGKRSPISKCAICASRSQWYWRCGDSLALAGQDTRTFCASMRARALRRRDSRCGCATRWRMRGRCEFRRW